MMVRQTHNDYDYDYDNNDDNDDKRWSIARIKDDGETDAQCRTIACFVGRTKKVISTIQQWQR